MCIGLISIIDVMQYPVEVLLGPCPRYLSQGRPHALQLLSKPHFLQESSLSREGGQGDTLVAAYYKHHCRRVQIVARLP